MAPEHLIDISSHNGVSSWLAVRGDGIVGASIKVSQQVNYVNPLLGVQAAGARAVGVTPGGYHFGDPRVDPAAQARFFVQNGSPHGLFQLGALAPMYDAEHWDGNFTWTKAQINKHIPEHIRVVREETGVQRHLVYASLSWWQSGFLDVDAWADDDVLFWIAVYNGQPGNLQGWAHRNNVLHQHTSTGIVPGIPGHVDKNVTLQGRTLRDLLIGEGDDDVQLTDRMENAWGGSVTLEEVFRYIDWRCATTSETVDKLAAGQTAILSAVAADRDISPEELTAIIGKAVKDNASTGNINIPELAAALAAELPDGVTQQDLINAMRSLQLTGTFRQVPTGG
jgi:GH25 family lysozyme M1 (1,4-beta-N-acetylmuramidase)